MHKLYLTLKLVFFLSLFIVESSLAQSDISACAPSDNSMTICQDQNLDCEKIYRDFNSILNARLENCLSNEECREDLIQGNLQEISDLPPREFLSTIRDADGKNLSYRDAVKKRREEKYRPNANMPSDPQKPFVKSKKHEDPSVDHIEMSKSSQKVTQELDKLKKEHQKRMNEIESR